MNLHANAALSLNKRRDLCRRVVDDRWTLKKAALAAEVSERCAGKWVSRYRGEGELGLLDRSSAPQLRPTCSIRQNVEVVRQPIAVVPPPAPEGKSGVSCTCAELSPSSPEWSLAFLLAPGCGRPCSGAPCSLLAIQ
jgi:hypothetical protein